MNQTSKLLTALKKCLKTRGVTYREVAEELDLSEASVKRLFSEESFSVQRLERVCRMLGMTLLDLARMARMEENEHVTILSIEQEQALADDPRLFATFYLLANEWKLSAIQKRFEIDKVETTKLLLRLDSLGLIDLAPKNKVKVLTARTIQWRLDGPVRKTHQAEATESFLNSDFLGDDSLLGMHTGELSEASLRILQQKVRKLEREFLELVEADLPLPLGVRKGVGMFIGLRPWNFFEWIVD